MPEIHILQWILVEKIRFPVNIYSNFSLYSVFVMVKSDSFFISFFGCYVVRSLCFRGNVLVSISQHAHANYFCKTKLPFERVLHPTYNPNGVIKGQSTTRWCKIKLVQRDRDKSSLNVLSCIENSVTY